MVQYCPWDLLSLCFALFDNDWKKLINSPECYDLLAERKAREYVEELSIELEKLAEAARVSARTPEDACQAEVMIVGVPFNSVYC